MRVLMVSSNALPAAPSGPAYVAGAVREAGHTVDVYEALFATDLAAELAGKLDSFRPDGPTDRAANQSQGPRVELIAQGRHRVLVGHDPLR